MILNLQFLKLKLCKFALNPDINKVSYDYGLQR